MARPIQERLDKFIRKRLTVTSRHVKTPCWEWQGTTAKGYGVFTVNTRKNQAHRFVYEWYVGPIPEGHDLDHECENRICVNPNHLTPATRKKNIQRRFERRGHCSKGHEYNEMNTRIKANGYRVCRVCDREAKRGQYVPVKAKALGPSKSMQKSVKRDSTRGRARATSKTT